MGRVEIGGHSDRRRPGRPRLDTGHIVDAAVKLVDDHGADALSMRSLAGHLGSSTATLYRHFPSRAALVAAMCFFTQQGAGRALGIVGALAIMGAGYPQQHPRKCPAQLPPRFVRVQANGVYGLAGVNKMNGR